MDNNYVKRVKNILIKNKVLLENFSYLSLLQIITIGTPFLLLPYFLRTLGPTKYGAIILSQTIVAYIAVAFNYGFDLYGSKAIAINKHDNKEMSKIISSILLIKISFAIFFFTVYYFIVILINLSHTYKLLYFFAPTLALIEIFLPKWYFQGIERMKFITMFVAISRIIYLVLVFLIIIDDSMFYIVPLLDGLSGMIAGVLGIITMYRYSKIDFIFMSVKNLKITLKEGLPYFLVKISSKFRDSSNVLIIGLLFTSAYIAYYDLAFKIVSIFIVIFLNVPIVILPKLSVTKDSLFAKKTFWFSIALASIFVLFTFFSSDWLILFIGGEEMINASYYLKGLSFYSVLFAANTLLSYYLIANDNQQVIFKSTIISLIVYFIFSSVLFINRSVIMLILVFLFASLIDLLYKIRVLKITNLMNWIYESKKKDKLSIPN